MRGKLHSAGFRDARGRIIPAHAGQTWATATTSTQPPDHPRTCGANRSSDTRPIVCRGSSPHMRGKLGVPDDADVDDRIIPAHAGQTRPRRGVRRGRADHPRTCGANRLCRGHRPRLRGSSPHMRGKHKSARHRHHLHRIIPAHAGQTEVE